VLIDNINFFGGTNITVNSLVDLSISDTTQYIGFIDGGVGATFGGDIFGKHIIVYMCLIVIS